MTDPRLAHFAVQAIKYTLTATGFIVVCYTNNPCHLWLRWTSTPPRKHVIPTERRGAPVSSYIDQCFVTFHDVEQDEAADTLEHSFLVAPWPHCQIRYFYFLGTIDGHLSPSRSCIFTKHRNFTWLPQTDYFYPHADHGFDSCDGRVWRILANQTWAEVHDGAGSGANTEQETGMIHISAFTNPNRWDAIHRLILTFPTTSIPPGALILDAKLRLYATTITIEGGNMPSVAVYQAYPDTFNDLIPADYNHIYATPLSDIQTFFSLTINQYFTLTLNPAGLAFVIPDGITELALREASYDAPNSPPLWHAHDDQTLMIAMADHANPPWRPRLEVTYAAPP